MIERKCDNCGKVFQTTPAYDKRSPNHRFCSRQCCGEFMSYKNTREHWKGGRITPGGYKEIYIDKKPIREHILIMENHIGRPLRKDEVVHHKNGDRLDNRIENLELMTRSEHARLHNPKTITICKRCGKETEKASRGLCKTCYAHEWYNDNLDKYEYNSEWLKIRKPKPRQRKEQV